MIWNFFYVFHTMNTEHTPFVYSVRYVPFLHTVRIFSVSPGMILTTLLQFMSVWNDFLFMHSSIRSCFLYGNATQLVTCISHLSVPRNFEREERSFFQRTEYICMTPVSFCLSSFYWEPWKKSSWVLSGRKGVNYGMALSDVASPPAWPTHTYFACLSICAPPRTCRQKMASIKARRPRRVCQPPPK